MLTTIYRALTHTLPIGRALSHPPATNTPMLRPHSIISIIYQASLRLPPAYLPLNSHARPNSPTHTLANHLLTNLSSPCTPPPSLLILFSSPALIPRRNRLLIHRSSFPTSLVYPLPPSPPHHQAQGVTPPIPHLLHSFPPLPIIHSPLLHPQVKQIPHHPLPPSSSNPTGTTFFPLSSEPTIHPPSEPPGVSPSLFPLPHTPLDSSNHTQLCLPPVPHAWSPQRASER